MKISAFDVHRKRHRLIGHVVVPLRVIVRLKADELFDRKPIWRDLVAEEPKCPAVGEDLKVRQEQQEQQQPPESERGPNGYKGEAA